MAKVFQGMLGQFGLTEKILTVNVDNATLNDTQTTKLSQMDNSFDKQNCVRCFNHTLQLSAKSLLKPFNTALSGSTTDDDMATQAVDDDEQVVYAYNEGQRGEEEEDIEGSVENDVEDDNIDGVVAGAISSDPEVGAGTRGDCCCS